MHVSRLKELMANLTQQQTFYRKIQKMNVSSVTESYELSQLRVKTLEIVCSEKVHLFKAISLTSNTS